MKSLEELRNQLDDIDTQLVDLLRQRVEVARGVADWKNSQPGEVPMTDPVREQEIIRRIQSKAQDPILQDCIAQVFMQLFALSKSVRILRKVQSQPFTHIGIIGDGLIGRSIAKVITAKSLNTEARPAVTIKNHDWQPSDFSNCDLIIIATPIDTVIDIAQHLARSGVLARGCTIIDVASVKREIAEQFGICNLEFSDLNFVPTHPMGGRQEQGNTYASATLFADRPWVITNVDMKNEHQKVNAIEDFVRYCGSTPVSMGAVEHDHFVAIVSHMPGLISKALADFVATSEPAALTVAGSGYDLMTRIGKTQNTRMRSQIQSHNQEEIDKALHSFVTYLQKLDPQIW